MVDRVNCTLEVRWIENRQTYYFLGYDPRCRAAIVRSITGSKRSQVDRYCNNVRLDVDDFPWTKPNVPKPEPVASICYESDTDQEEDEVKTELKEEELLLEPVEKKVQQYLVPPKIEDDFVDTDYKHWSANDDGADIDYDNCVLSAEDIARRLDANSLDEGLPIAVRRSTRTIKSAVSRCGGVNTALCCEAVRVYCSRKPFQAPL